MLVAALYILIIFIATYVLGKAYLQLFGKWLKLPVFEPTVGLTNIVGLAVVAPIVGIYHLFFAIDLPIVLFFLAQVFLFAKQSSLGNLFIHVKRFKTIYLGLLLAGVVSIIFRPGSGDIGDYHLQAILWAKKFPNIIGLGNFNRPLANNNWWFNLQALLGIESISLYGLNALFFICVMLYFIFDTSEYVFVNSLKYVFLLFTAISTKTAFVGSVTPDYIVTNLIFVCAYLFAKYLAEEKVINVYIVLLLSLFAVTIKLNAIVLLLLSLAALIIHFKSKILVFKNWFPVILLGSVFIIPWLIGNVIVSGWLAYPVNVIDLFNVDWKVPVDVLKYERFSIMQWGKIQYQDIYITAQLSVSEWFPIWFKNNDIFNKILILVTPVLLVLALIFNKVDNKKLIYSLILFGIIGTAFCFSNGPHIRYAYGYILVLVATGFSILYTRFIAFTFTELLVMFVYLSLLPVMINLFSLAKQDALISSLLLPKKYQESTANLTQLGSENVYLTEQNNNCWNLFPCSYYMVNGCKLRGADFKDGFSVKH